MSENVCELKHHIIDDRLDGHDKRLDEVEHRQTLIEQGAIKTETIVANLCKKIDLLISILIGIAGSAFLLLIGFFISYIQKL